ncbi:hypothetical protein [Rhodococcus gannanensis]|uniref:DUF4303 domain-containing protein n=1 Tax=Rhodococcus gannanensis TaxID=1960308 RepID=A0ABW4P7A6_9NOCA
MHDFTRLDDAILTTLRTSIGMLREENDSLALVACGMVEDLTGFFVAGADATWLTGLDGSSEDRAQSAWWPSEWPHGADDPSDTAPGRVTSAIWALSGTQAVIDGTGKALEGEAYDALCRDYEHRIVLALRQLQAEGELRDSAGRELWVWLHSADDSDSELDERTFGLLQSSDLAADFSERFGAGSDRLLNRIARRT